MSPIPTLRSTLLLALFLASALPALAQGVPDSGPVFDRGPLAEARALFLSSERRSDCLLESLVPPGVSVTGRTVDTSGEPVAGVEIFVDRNPRQRLGSRDGRPRLPLMAISDEEGYFEVPELLAGEPLQLEVWHRHFRSTFSAHFEPPLDGLEIELEAFGRLWGRVISEAGEPIAEAGLFARPEQEVNDAAFQSLSAPTATTNERGEFFFERLEPAERYRVVASALGYPSREVSGLESGQEVEIVLEPGVSLRGKVLDPAGDPVAGADVGILRPELTDRSLELLLRQRTGGDGRFELPSTVAGTRMVEAIHPRFERLVREVEVEDGEQELVLQFERVGGHAVTGQVVDGTLSPVPDLVVHLGQVDGNRYFRDRTDAEGRFRFEPMPDGRYRPSVDSEELVLVDVDQELVVQGRSIDGWTLRLRTGATLRGRILGLGPEDLGRARIFSGRPERRRGEIDVESGSYSITGLSSGHRVVVAQAPGHRQARAAVTLEPDASEARLDLVFAPPIELTGEVRRRGRPLGNALVRVEPPSEGFGRSARTDVEGRFEVEGLPPGPSTVQVYTSGQAKIHSKERLVHTESIDLESDVFLRIEVTEASLEGEIRDAVSGEPIVMAIVELYDVERMQKRHGPIAYASTFAASTDRAGRFELESLPRGAYLLVAAAQGYSRTEQELKIGTEPTPPLALELEPSRSLVLELSAALGAIPQHVETLVFDREGRIYSRQASTTLVGGRVPIENVPEGRWNVHVRSDGGGLVALAHDLPVPGPPARITLSPGGSLRILVPALFGEPTPASLHLADELGRPWPNMGSKLRFGEASLISLPPGTWTLRVRTADGREWSGAVGVESGRTVVVELE